MVSKRVKKVRRSRRSSNNLLLGQGRLGDSASVHDAADLSVTVTVTISYKVIKRKFRTENPSYGWLELLNLILPLHHIGSACPNLTLQKPPLTSNSNLNFAYLYSIKLPEIT